MNKLERFYYIATAYLPRRLPRTEKEFLRFKDVIVEAYGVKDEPVTWHCVSGHIGSTPPTKLRRAWGDLANVAKRLGINQLAASYRAKAQKDLEDRLKELHKAESERLALIDQEAEKNTLAGSVIALMNSKNAKSV